MLLTFNTKLNKLAGTLLIYAHIGTKIKDNNDTREKDFVKINRISFFHGKNICRGHGVETTHHFVKLIEIDDKKIIYPVANAGKSVLFSPAC